MRLSCYDHFYPNYLFGAVVFDWPDITMEQPNPASSGSRLAVVISPSKEVFGALQPLLNEQIHGVKATHLGYYPPPQNIGRELGSGAAGFVFLDVTTQPNEALPLLTEVARLNGINVLALLSNDDPDLILRCLRAGAADFLIAPYTREQLEAAIEKSSKLHAPPEMQASSLAKVIAIFPAKGASGATTLACNLAFAWKKASGKRVLLAELDHMTGTVSFLLKIKSVFSFVDVLTRADELDQDLWTAMVSKVGGVDVLLAPESVTETPVDLRDPEPILRYARANYDVVILDAGSIYGDWNLNQARTADEILLVTTNELPALQAAQRCMAYMDTNRIGNWKLHLILNRYNKDVGLSREVIGTALHTDVFETLPSDYDAVQKALMEGKAVVPASPYGKGIRKLAERLGGKAEKTQQQKKASSGGALSSLLGLFSKQGSK